MKSTYSAFYASRQSNRDGVVNYTDASICFADYGAAQPTGQLSATDNVIGYAGYVFNAEMHGGGLYTVRNRHYSPELGRWITRDPIGYVDGMSLYEYVQSSPKRFHDAFGLCSSDLGRRRKSIIEWRKDMIGLGSA